VSPTDSQGYPVHPGEGRKRTVREAASQREALDGADAQALEHALRQCEIQLEYVSAWKAAVIDGHRGKVFAHETKRAERNGRRQTMSDTKVNLFTADGTQVGAAMVPATIDGFGDGAPSLIEVDGKLYVFVPQLVGFGSAPTPKYVAVVPVAAMVSDA